MAGRHNGYNPGNRPSRLQQNCWLALRLNALDNVGQVPRGILYRQDCFGHTMKSTFAWQAPPSHRASMAALRDREKSAWCVLSAGRNIESVLESRMDRGSILTRKGDALTLQGGAFRIITYMFTQRPATPTKHSRTTPTAMAGTPTDPRTGRQPGQRAASLLRLEQSGRNKADIGGGRLVRAPEQHRAATAPSTRKPQDDKNTNENSA